MGIDGLVASTNDAMTFNKKDIISYITSRRQRDGGFHFANTEPSSRAGTFCAVKVISRLGESMENPEKIYRFFEQLIAEKDLNDVVSLYFTMESLATLKIEMPKKIPGLGLEDLVNQNNKFSLMNKNKKLFVESVSGLSNFFLTSIAKNLDRHPDEAIVTYIMSHKNTDNGFGHDNFSTIPDTYFALATFDNVDSLHISGNTLSFLKLANKVANSYLEYVYWHFMNCRLLRYFPDYTKRNIFI